MAFALTTEKKAELYAVPMKDSASRFTLAPTQAPVAKPAPAFNPVEKKLG